MTYELLGFTFTFGQDENGAVTSITTPNLSVGITTIPSYTLNFSPALTVAQAEQLVADILAMLGIS